MTQAETIRALDASIFASLAGAGITDLAAYTPSSGGVAIADCRVLIDRGVSLQNQFTGQSIDDAIVLTCYAADVGAAPQRGARFVIGSEVFSVDSLSNKDESRYVLIVKPGT